MLRNTLILPEDKNLAIKLLDDAIADLGVVLMLVIGNTERITQLVTWADQLCDKTATAQGNNVRRVIWIRDPSTLGSRLRKLLGTTATPTVAVLNFHDEVKERLVDDSKSITPVTLELAFLKGFQV
jgi:hypothetical protein